MTLRKLVGMQAGVEDLEFQIKPRSLVFQGKTIGCFVVYLQKGMQVIGRYESGIKHNTKDSLYRFKNPEIGTFRLRNLNHATYTWNLYRVDPSSGLEEFEDTVSFDIKQTVQLYEVQLLQKEREIQTSYKEKNIVRTAVLDLWKKAKKQMKNSKPLLKCIFHKLSIHLEFQIEIRNSLDLQLIEYQTKYPGMRRVKSQYPPFILPNLNSNQSEIVSKPKVSQPLIIIDECISPLLRAAKKAHEVETSPQQTAANFNQTKRTNETEDSQTVVRVKNPKGKQLGQSDYNNRTLKRSGSNSLEPVINLQQPNKKFSMLSDIIEQSHEGSSTIGQEKFTNNGMQNFYPDKADQIEGFDVAKRESKNIVTVDSPLNKFKTLPYDNFNARKVKEQNLLKVDLRRAQTTGKDEINFKQNSEHNIGDQYQTNSELRSSDGMDKVKENKGVTGDINAKYIILLGIFIILGIIGKELFSECRGPKCKKQKAAKKARQ